MRSAIRGWCAAGLAMAGLTVGALGCSSSGLQLPGSMNGDGVGGSAAGGSGVGGSGAGGSGVGGSGIGIGGKGAGGSGAGGLIVEVADAHYDMGGVDRGRDVGSVGGTGAGGSGVGGVGMDGSAGGCGVGGTDAGGTAADAGGDSIVGTAIALFNCSTEGFVFSTYDEPTNLARPTNPVVPQPTFSFDATQGSPFPGSVQVTAPFSGANQYVDIQKTVNVPAPLDWSGKSLHVRVRVTQGTFNGIVQPYVVTTGAYSFGGTSINIVPGSAWQEFQIDVTNPMTRSPGYNPAQVMLVGVHLTTGGAGANSTPVVFNIDSFYVSP